MPRDKKPPVDSPPLHPKVQAFLEGLDDKPDDCATAKPVGYYASGLIGRSRLAKPNADKKIPQEERAKIISLFDQMISSYPDKTSCYRAIGSQESIEFERVRYIVEKLR